MDTRLLNYKEISGVDHLDGRYFNIVLARVPGVIPQALTLRVSNNGVSVLGSAQIPRSQQTQYLRLIIEFVENQDNQVQNNQAQVSPRRVVPPTPFPSPENPQLNAGSPMIPPPIVFSPSPSPSPVLQPSPLAVRSPVDGTVVARHSNLLIIDNARRRIQRFEPLDDNDFDPLINAELMRILALQFPGYEYKELSVHPQKDNSIGLCVGYIIKYVYFHANGEPVSFEGNYDIYRFSKAIVKLYGELDARNADVEFGRYYGYNPIGGALPILGGAVAGGLIGSALAGGPGFAAGALTGGLVGGLAASPYYY